MLDILVHLVAADDALRRDDLAQPAVLELLAREIGEDNTVAPREHQLARFASAGENQLRIALEDIDGGMGVAARLFKRAFDGEDAPVGMDAEVRLVSPFDAVRLPILHFENQQAAPGMEDDEIGMPRRRPEGDVVPAEIVVFELGLQTLRQSALAAGDRSAGNLPQYHERGLIRQNRHENSALTEDYPEFLTLPLYEAME